MTGCRCSVFGSRTLEGFWTDPEHTLNNSGFGASLGVQRLENEWERRPGAGNWYAYACPADSYPEIPHAEPQASNSASAHMYNYIYIYVYIYIIYIYVCIHIYECVYIYILERGISHT